MLCREFHCTPRQLEEEFDPTEAEDFDVILGYVAKAEAAERRRAEAAARR
jgi:hypothetical protein